ncbi:MAG: peptidylprolyl isomerase, partial [Candidatus Levybacteria bacterium]|nr:peptidylprolyl isomerase [Candidatus Levybacteria bacterium]
SASLSLPQTAPQTQKLNIPISSSPKPKQLSPTPLLSEPEIAPVAAPLPKERTVILKTSKGDIELTLFLQDAPNSAKNFTDKARSGFYQNLTFHRVEDWVVQGGDPNGDGTGGGKMPTELNQKPFVPGSLGIARGSDIRISNDAQFFITKKEASWLNGQYTNFGIVTKGMEVAEQIQIGDKILGITTE